jgi:CheY-like chemotaxis protein
MRPEPSLGQNCDLAVSTPVILIVEDNQVSTLILRAMLKKCGHEALVATDGQEGIDVAVRQRPRLVFMDLQMPRVDGFAAAREIRRVCGRDASILVAATAGVTPEVRHACEDAGFACVLGKPIRLEELHALVERYLAA